MNNNNKVNNVGLILQALSLQLLFLDYNNTDLMQELQKQDTQYFERLLKQNEEILNILKERRENQCTKE